MIPECYAFRLLPEGKIMRTIAGLGLVVLLVRGAWGRASLPAFDVASIKPTPPNLQNQLRIDRCTSSPNRYFSGGAPLIWTISYGFRVPDSRVVGGPSWLATFADAYEIEGKADGPVTANQCRLMIQSLLADRFKLRVHREMREVAAYELTIAKDTRKTLSKLHEVRKDDTGGGGHGVRINGPLMWDPSEREAAEGWPMSRIASYISDIPDVNRPVIDKTGLKGIYSFTLDFSRTQGDDRPSIFTALPEQLGLRLKSAKSSVEFLVIDHIERPSEN